MSHVRFGRRRTLERQAAYTRSAIQTARDVNAIVDLGLTATDVRRYWSGLYERGTTIPRCIYRRWWERADQRMARLVAQHEVQP